MANIPGDIIFFVVVAVVLLVQFNSILGKGEKDDVIDAAKKDALKKANDMVKQSQVMAGKAMNSNFLEIPKDVFEKAGNISKTVQKGIDEITSQEKSFSLEEFVTGSIKAFGIIVLAYTKGNLPVLKGMLDDDLFEAFKKDIAKRKKKENIDTKIDKLNDITVTKAKLQGSMMYITIKFISEQTTAIRDEDGQVLKGDPEQPHEITDIWTFAKDGRSDNPNWTLVSSES